MSHLNLRHVRTLTFLLSVFAVATAAHAASITITQAQSDTTAITDAGAIHHQSFMVDVSGSPAWTGASAADSVSAGGADHAAATATSSIQPPAFAATGAINLAGASTSDLLYAVAQGEYFVAFELSDPFTYSWTSHVSAAFDPGPTPVDRGYDYARGVTYLLNVATSTYLQYVDAIANASTPIVADAFTGSGLLLPGKYWLAGNAYSQVQGGAGVDFAGSGSFDLALTLTPVNATAVPEPTTLALVGLGAIAAALRKRRRDSRRACASAGE